MYMCQIFKNDCSLPVTMHSYNGSDHKDDDRTGSGAGSDHLEGK